MKLDMSRFEAFHFEIHAHLNPQIMTTEIKTDGLDIERLKKYSDRIHAFNQSLRKVKRYEVYFESFYPEDSELIPPHEALEHHVHAYLQDLAILSNNVVLLMNTLSKDMSKFASNKDEICVQLKEIKEKVFK